MIKHYRIGLIVLCGLVFAPSACQFDSTVLDERRCTNDDECPGNYRCIDNICQGIPPDWDMGEPDIPDEVEEVDPCHDYDNDGVRAGVGCTDAVLDCNDFDPDIYPGIEDELNPAPEVCDGKDNDCDGLTDTADDQAPVYIPDPCPLNQGECSGSTRACVGGIPQDCTAASYSEHYQAVEEDCEDLENPENCCDDRDNDCDGDTDEGITLPCYDGDSSELYQGSPCAMGVRYCDGEGVWTTECYDQALPQPETDFDNRCDSIDNDCDGDTDEDCVCNPGSRELCYPLAPLFLDDPTRFNPPCTAGVRTCGTDFHWGDCIGYHLPSVETCADPGVDNDCDGNIGLDEIDDYGDSCTDSGEPGECADGTLYCTLDADGDPILGCVPDKAPALETCDNRETDDDCDGDSTDSDIPGFGDECWVTEFLSVPVLGECRLGSMECDDTATPPELICRPSTGSMEVCDGFDNDCDNLTDMDDDIGDVGDPETTLEFDEDNCGACYVQCDTDETCCDGTCVDTDFDATYCGSCGTSCSSPSAPVCCGGSCTDLDYDEANCGTCGITCESEEDCCEGTCIVLASNTDHCGECGFTCPTGENWGCYGGQCVDTNTDFDYCGETETDCDFVTGADACCGGECLDTEENTDHCGQCGRTCPDDTSEEDWECYDSHCVDTHTDFDHCGDTPTHCVTVTGADACCGGECVDTEENPDHCGKCGSTCPSDIPEEEDWECYDSHCVDTKSDFDYCGSDPLTDCDDVTGADACCDGKCVDLAVGLVDSGSTSHCGVCGNTCLVEETCCDGFCVDTDTNLDHCGGCGADCDPTLGCQCEEGVCTGPEACTP